MKKIFGFLFIALAAGVWADAEVTIQRASSKINAGFKERVFIDGKQVLQLANGRSGKVKVSSGEHVIHAQLSTLETEKMSFSVGSGPINLVITPYSLDSFVIEQPGGVPLHIAAAPPPAAPPPLRRRLRPGPRPQSIPTALKGRWNGRRTGLWKK
jgi:hypothetical protein